MNMLSFLLSTIGRYHPKKLVPRGLLCTTAMVLTFGCESPTEVADSTALLTDGTSFRLEREGSRGHVWYRVQIPYSFTNRTGSRVYIENCLGDFSIDLEMQEAGEWVHFWSPVIRACLSAPIVIEPDEVYRTTLDAVGCTSGGSCAPRLILPPTASTPYRIVWWAALSSYDLDANPRGERIPLEERISNSFTLQVSR